MPLTYDFSYDKQITQILNFQRRYFWALGNPCMISMNLQIKFGKIVQEVAEMCLFVYFEDGGRSPSWLCYSPVLDHPRSPLDGLYLPCKQCNDPVWCDRDIAMLGCIIIIIYFAQHISHTQLQRCQLRRAGQ